MFSCLSLWCCARPKAELYTVIGGSVESDYELLNIIGNGKTCRVARAKSRSTGDIVAVKMIATSYLTTTSRVEALTSELHALSLVRDDTATLCLREIYQDDQFISIVTDFIQGAGIVHGLTAHKTINEHIIRSLVSELTNALASLHARGITHRDLKPENLLLDSDGHLRLIDFGLAHIHNKSAPHGLCGTGPFMAPEVFNTDKSYSSKVDVWALGACTYVFLTGHLPFEANFLSQMEDKIKAGKYSLPFGHIISNQAQAFIQACLTVDVNARPTAKDLLRHQWLNRNENLPQYTRNFAESHLQCLRAYADPDIICPHKKVYAII